MACTLVVLGLLSFALQADALQLQLEVSGKGNEHKHVALCLSGIARAFTYPGVVPSLKNFMEGINASGFASRTQPDVFAYMAAKDSTNFERDPVDNDEAVLKERLKVLNAVSYQLPQDPMEVTNETLEEFVATMSCHNGGFWAQDKKHMIDSLNQILRMQKCMQLVVDHEEKLHQKYDAVIIARPDLVYNMGLPDHDVLSKVYSGTVWHDSDRFLALPRGIAQKLIPARNEKTLNCKEGELCCGKVQRTEDMLEFKLGVVIALGGNCNCATESNPNVHIHYWHIEGKAYEHARWLLSQSQESHETQSTLAA